MPKVGYKQSEKHKMVNAGKIPWNKGVQVDREKYPKMGNLKHFIEYKGRTLSIKALSQELGLNSATLWQRLFKYKLPIEKALTGEKYLQEQDGRKITWGAKIAKSLTGQKRNPLTEEHKRKIGRKGELNHKYIKDRTLLKDDHRDRGGQLHREWSKSVKNRDNWKCKISNNDCSGKLEAHHIVSWSKSPELRYEVNNGITLCHYHHPKKRKEEQRFAPVFQEMVLSPAYVQA